MKHIAGASLLLSCVVINLVHCQQNVTWLTTTQMSLANEDPDCPLWFVFNTAARQCECYTNPSTNGIVKCKKQEAEIKVGYCMTYEERERLLCIAPCFYFHGDTRSFNTTNDNYIRLAKNISQLNDYMCGPMNRKGRVCSECINGFGPSIISIGSVCSNCTDAWYGVPLYLFLEFVPITIFYVIILLFRINVTSAPMVAFVFFSQMEVKAFISYAKIFLLKSRIAYNFLSVLTTLYGFWNLDFFRYILPSFCISPKLKLIHITFLYYISAFYPLCLIGITWICIELHFRRIKPIVWLWSKLTRCNSKRPSPDHSNSLVDVFATLFLLSYAKIVFTSFRLLIPTSAVMVNSSDYSVNGYQLAVDPRIEYFSKQQLPFIIISILILLFAILPLTLLLVLHPVKLFRLLLFKLHLSTRTIASLNIFVEKFHSCYKDGTVGGRDMRSFASMYFLLRLLSFIFLFVNNDVTFYSTVFTFTAILYGGCSLIISLVRPYKKPYMNIIDALILGIMLIIALMLDKNYQQESSDLLTSFYTVTLCIFSSLPLLGLAGFITCKILKSPLIKLMIKVNTPFCTRLLCFNSCSEQEAVNKEIAQQENLDDGGDPELPDRVLHPKQYEGEMITIKREDIPVNQTPHVHEVYVNELQHSMDINT